MQILTDTSTLNILKKITFFIEIHWFLKKILLSGAGRYNLLGGPTLGYVIELAIIRGAKCGFMY